MGDRVGVPPLGEHTDRDYAADVSRRACLSCQWFHCLSQEVTVGELVDICPGFSKSQGRLERLDLRARVLRNSVPAGRPTRAGPSRPGCPERLVQRPSSTLLSNARFPRQAPVAPSTSSRSWRQSIEHELGHDRVGADQDEHWRRLPQRSSSARSGRCWSRNSGRGCVEPPSSTAGMGIA